MRGIPSLLRTCKLLVTDSRPTAAVAVLGVPAQPDLCNPWLKVFLPQAWPAAISSPAHHIPGSHMHYIHDLGEQVGLVDEAGSLRYA